MPQISMLHLSKQQLKRKLKYAALSGSMLVSAFLGYSSQHQVLGDDALFLVPTLTIQEQGDSEVAAKKSALLKAKRQAYQELVQILVPVRQQGKMPALSDKELENLVYTTDIPSERMSQGAGLYVADIQIGFRPDLMRNFFKQRGIAFSETRSRPLLVLPVMTQGTNYQLWEDSNEWRLAWANSDLTPGLVPLEQPLGDISDISEITSDDALALDQEKLMSIAAKYGASGVVLTIADIASVENGQPPVMSVSNVIIAEGWSDDITIYDFTSETQPIKETETVTNVPSGISNLYEKLYTEAIDVVYSSLQERWKETNLIDPNVQGNSLLMNIPLANLNEWLKIRSMLDGMTMVQRYKILNINVDEANVLIEYSGRTVSLQSALKQLNYNLAFNDDVQGWSLMKR
ncbi:DUF2066 domain-containing protein [Curvivirga aplysinae]|uniref:DUF2066 domain-containing protein n=1 Tax=Curvivirga aplysinae TaxID=2529852 RepID=UPI0012BCEF86|nr:DUF2066 domain-containing protein [Curvivirga aplysinae]MTI10535.1 DUF2066 domain-containing protein [Curvivirga aplysinae]